MKIAVVGGKLQGVEAVYLAHKAGWEVVLIDKNPIVPASGLADVFIQLDVNDTGRLSDVLKGVEMVIPATENIETLQALERWNRTSSIRLVYEGVAYRISSSKLESNRLFAGIGVPVPGGWPDCGFPVVAKPSGGSGSEGVRVFSDQKQLRGWFRGSLPPEGWVLQEYVEGPSYSLEVVGVPGSYEALQVTDLEMDAGYDCKRVSAPTALSAKLTAEFERISLKIAEAVRLRGLMDVEVILHKGELKVLEIDARLPSQTPTVVYLSSGCNILEHLPQIKVFGSRHAAGPVLHNQKGVVYEHIKVTAGELEVCGEHIMAGAGVLRLCEDFYGADEAITNYVPGRDEWVATLMVTGNDGVEAWEKRERVIAEIRKAFKLDVYKDPTAMMYDE